MNSNPGFRVLDSEDPYQYADWLRLWSQWEQRDVFAHPAYVCVDRDLRAGAFGPYGEPEAARPAALAKCAVWESDLGIVLYPFLLRDLSSEPYWRDGTPAFDIITPYGYGGPFVCSGSPEILAQMFWPAFGRWTRSLPVISELIRFSLFEGDLLPYPATREHVFDNVVRLLDLDEKALWSDFEYKVRKNVNRARLCGVTVEVDPTGSRLDDFFRIYIETMERRHADARYGFPRAYFEAIQERLPGQFCYFHAIHHGCVISSELTLVSESRVYSFLGGTDAASFQHRPNDLLKHEIMLWAKRNQKAVFVLGGGYQRDDGIFRYKKSFAPAGSRAFVLGKRVFDEATYERLVENRRSLSQSAGAPWNPAPGFFPEYRG